MTIIVTMPREREGAFKYRFILPGKLRLPHLQTGCLVFNQLQSG